MDIKINRTDADVQCLEYNATSGILDPYFMDDPSPIEVAQQYSEVAGKAAMMPYWRFGLHGADMDTETSTLLLKLSITSRWLVPLSKQCGLISTTCRRDTL